MDHFLNIIKVQQNKAQKGNKIQNTHRSYCIVLNWT